MRFEVARGFLCDASAQLARRLGLTMGEAVARSFFVVGEPIAPLSRETQIDDVGAHGFLRKASRLTTFGSSLPASFGFSGAGSASFSLASAEVLPGFSGAALRVAGLGSLAPPRDGSLASSPSSFGAAGSAFAEPVA